MIVALLDRHTDNDPINKVDPLGLRPKDATVVLVDDFQLTTGQYDSPDQNVFGRALGWAMDQATGYEPIDHAGAIQRWSGDALMDPRLVWGVIAVESRLRQSFPKPGGQAWDHMSIPKGFVTGGEPSLGIGNMQQDIFQQTMANHPNIGSGAWGDLIRNDGLAIATTTYHLRDLDNQLVQEVARRKMKVVPERGVVPEISGPDSFRTVYVRRTHILAAAYNASSARIDQSLNGNGFGAATQYVQDVQRRMEDAGAHYCTTGTLSRC